MGRVEAVEAVESHSRPAGARNRPWFFTPLHCKQTRAFPSALSLPLEPALVGATAMSASPPGADRPVISPGHTRVISARHHERVELGRHARTGKRLRKLRGSALPSFISRAFTRFDYLRLHLCSCLCALSLVSGSGSPSVLAPTNVRPLVVSEPPNTTNFPPLPKASSSGSLASRPLISRSFHLTSRNCSSRLVQPR